MVHEHSLRRTSYPENERAAVPPVSFRSSKGDDTVIHTPLGKVEQLPSGKWLGYLEIGPRTDAEGPIWPIAQIEGRTREQLMQRMLNEARFQMNLLGEMIHWAENQEWARRKGK